MTENAVRKLTITLFVFVLLGIILMLFYSSLTGHYWVTENNVYKFEGVAGPLSKSKVITAKQTDWKKYDEGSSSRLGILLTDKNSSWLGLVHGLKTIGVPFRLTTDINQAIKHNTLMVYPKISGKVLNANKLKALASFVHDGGNLIGVNVLGGGLEPIFGFAGVKPSRKHTSLEFQNDHIVMQEFDNMALRKIKLNSTKNKSGSFGSNIYLKPKHKPLAYYNDGTAAIVYNKFKSSETFAIGFDIGFYLLKAYNRRLGTVADTYANNFEPSVDNLLRLIKAVYISTENRAVSLGTVPHDHSLSVILTHDVDYNRSLENALLYAKHESNEKTSATYFIQTKYISDWNDKVFFDEKNLVNFNKLQKYNVEVASHSVSHSQSFGKFSLGNGDEYYPNYTPFVKNKMTTYNATILGELRVSKFLLQYFSDNKEVVSFRPGHLSNPLALPQALQATEYQFSSSVSANVSLTHLPFRLNHNRDIYSETSIYEFPITVEDELPPKLENRLESAIALAHKIRRYGGVFVVLIHTNVLAGKIAFQKGFVRAMKPYAWFGSLRQFGEWWSARDKVKLDVTKTKDKYFVNVNASINIEGLVLKIPKSWRLLKTKQQRNIVQKKTGRVLIKSVKGDLELVFTVN